MSLFAEPLVKSLVSAVFEALIAHDGEHITDANERAARMFGYAEPQALVGMPYTALLARQGLQTTRPRVETQSEGRYTTTCRHQDGAEFAVDVNAREIDYGGRRLRIVAFRYPYDDLPSDHPLIQRATALDRTVRAISRAIEQRDSLTAGHQSRVSDLAVRLADRIGMGARAASTIRIAGSLHDIGKIGVPTEILMKPGELTRSEREIMQTHPQLGFTIIEEISFDGPVAQAILQHHERLDGNGYPAGIDDPIAEARVLMVADVFDALTSSRFYRESMPATDAVAMMQDSACGKLDPLVLEQLPKVLH